MVVVVGSENAEMVDDSNYGHNDNNAQGDISGGRGGGGSGGTGDVEDNGGIEIRWRWWDWDGKVLEDTVKGMLHPYLAVPTFEDMIIAILAENSSGLLQYWIVTAGFMSVVKLF
ncbi:hypothetical protein NC653_027250 [Populus alba x Populus x berolinensis]|uniref:Uncharacterized protein n=1 Tax=Populus alba x Populus x berolinensis TaxID=444605 RepID=A0AAD6Q4T9_9ROSI|nr:hypothetical protein NC653_027250 [Populus alba x Populus x berolinensis]